MWIRISGGSLPNSKKELQAAVSLLSAAWPSSGQVVYGWVGGNLGSRLSTPWCVRPSLGAASANNEGLNGMLIEDLPPESRGGRESRDHESSTIIERKEEGRQKGSRKRGNQCDMSLGEEAY